MIRQTEDTPYSYEFSANSKMTTKDLRMHNCKQCGYLSVIGSNMKSHMLVQIKERPYICKQCNYSCTQAGDLKKHMLSANPFRRKTFHLHTV